MTNVDKLGMIVAVATVIIFVGIAAGGSSLEQTISKDITSAEKSISKDVGMLEKDVSVIESEIEPSKTNTKTTDPSADIAAKVKAENPSDEEIKENQQSQEDKVTSDMNLEEKEFEDSLDDYKSTAKEGNTGPQTINVDIPVGTSVPGCEETNECFSPASVNINLDDVVIWTNQDSAAHTVTSGSPSEGPDGNFDSSLIMAGETFEFPFDTSGSYDYFCMVHPWMTGTISVTS